MTRSSSSLPFICAANLNAGVEKLDDWLLEQAIHVAPGWTEACVAWLAEEKGGFEHCAQLTETNWHEMVYEQWLHTDLRQLSCPILPNNDDNSHTAAVAMKLDGELCLQVVALFNIGESYYGQLRRQEGNLSDDVPSLEAATLGDADGDPNNTQMTQAHSRYHTSSQSRISTPSAVSSPSVSLFLTDGVVKIKAIEFGQLDSTASCRNGSNRTRSATSLSFEQLAERLRPGVKVRLRGPLILRNNVLLLPPGSLSSLNSDQLQVLGGEVDELLCSNDGHVYYQLGRLLANKLNIDIPETGELPSWFPPIAKAPSKPTTVVDPVSGQGEEEQRQPSPPIFSSTQMATQERIAAAARPASVSMVQPRQQSISNYPTNLAPHTSSVNPPLLLDPWGDDDDVLIAEAASNMEDLLHSSSVSAHSVVLDPLNRRSTNVYHAPGSNDTDDETKDSDDTEIAIETEVDPDVLASAFDELEKNDIPLPIRTSTIDETIVKSIADPLSRINTVMRNTTGSMFSASFPDGNSKPSGGLRQSTLVVNSSNNALKRLDHFQPLSSAKVSKTAEEESIDLLPKLPAKRKPWECRRPVVSTVTASTSAVVASAAVPPVVPDPKFHPFCYIQDMYNELIDDDSTNFIPRRRVYTIRGLLISLLSSLEHHRGTRWTLSARLSDGSATVDVDISSDLLTSWIGLTAAESESLRQLSQVSKDSVDGQTASPLALQEAQKHRQKLRTALSNFQSRLSNLTGLFDVSPPAPSVALEASRDTLSDNANNSTSSSNKPIRPILVAYRQLDCGWLADLHERVKSRWSS